MSNTGRIIRERRKELKMTQEELAHKVGYKSRASINKIELERDIPFSKLKPICEALDLNVYSIVGNKPEINYSFDDEELCQIVKICKELSDENRQRVIEIASAFLIAQNRKE